MHVVVVALNVREPGHVPRPFIIAGLLPRALRPLSFRQDPLHHLLQVQLCPALQGCRHLLRPRFRAQRLQHRLGVARHLAVGRRVMPRQSQQLGRLFQVPGAAAGLGNGPLTGTSVRGILRPTTGP